MTNCVYLIRVIDTDFFYVGSTQGIEVRLMVHMRQMRCGIHHNVRLQGLWNAGCLLTIDVISCVDREAAFDLEQKILTENSDNPNMLNICLSARGGDNLTRNPNREIIVDKITAAIIKRWEKMSSEDRERHRQSRLGKNNGMFGRNHTAEAKAIMSAVNKGHSRNKGMVRSEEVKKALSERAMLRVGEKNPFYGKTHSEETKRKISEAFKGVLPPNTNALKIDGVLFESQAAAARHLRVSIGTIHHRIKSNNPKYSGYTVIKRESPNE